VPVAVEGITAAVNVTDCPLTDGLRLDVRVVVVVVFVAVTLWDSVAEMLPL